ncbi:MAG: ABC transporter substrate-binding protein [Candidatus Accumulibacter sp.]|jgi:hypothetical protein|nr:ABC transporter substrate-binding protein [Accumulibacter sp.]
MSFHSNPFLRGYESLKVQRVLEILCDVKRPLSRRALHPSQTHLSHDRIAQKSCLFYEGYAVITEGQRIPKELRAQCDGQGVVVAVRYSILADEDGQPVPLGDAFSRADADAVIRRVRFDTGVYSRCWEISSGHLDQRALLYLESLADSGAPFGPFFCAFRLPDDAIGVKLIGTPWNDAHLRDIDGTGVMELRQAHWRHGMPQSLLHVLHLAGEADVRVLIFDGGAPQLDGLPSYDHD